MKNVSEKTLQANFQNGKWEAVTDRFGSNLQYQEVRNTSNGKRFTVNVK